MSKAKFTKGPWFFDIDSDCVYDSEGNTICDCMPSEPEHFGNAILISTATEMYALLEDLRSAVSLAGITGADNQKVIESIDSLLAKARGE